MTGRKHERQTERVHHALKCWFTNRGLELDDVWYPVSDSLDQQNRHLEQLQCWVIAYEQCPDRDQLARQGFIYPPLSPGMGPDEDWFRFRRWTTGQPISWRYTDVFGHLPHPSELNEASRQAQIQQIIENLESRQVALSLHDGVPSKLVYAYLRQTLTDEPFELLPHVSTTWLDGCSGYCPDCFQRPWCEVGMEPDWEEEGWPEPLATPEAMSQWLERINADLEAAHS